MFLFEFVLIHERNKNNKNLKIKERLFQADCGTQNRLDSKQGHACVCIIYNNSGSGYC
jgi:hypothetical protein